MRGQLSLLDETFRTLVTLERTIHRRVCLHPVKLFVLLRRKTLRTEIASVQVWIKVDLDVLQQVASFEQFLVATSMKTLLTVHLPKVPP